MGLNWNCSSWTVLAPSTTITLSVCFSRLPSFPFPLLHLRMDPGPLQRPTTWPSTWTTSWPRQRLRSPSGRLRAWAGSRQWLLKPRTWCLWRTRLRSWTCTVSPSAVGAVHLERLGRGCGGVTEGCGLYSGLMACSGVVCGMSLTPESLLILTPWYPDVNMYLSNKLFRTSQPPLNLSDSTKQQQDSQVSLLFFTSLLKIFLLSLLSALTFLSSPFLFLPQAPEITVTTESAIPRDASGAIDHTALVELLKDMQSLQDQADILYILFKDKWDDAEMSLSAALNLCYQMCRLIAVCHLPDGMSYN